MYQLTAQEEWLCTQIVDIAYKVHLRLGPGLLEKIYEACFCYELKKRMIPFERQCYQPIIYDDMEFDEGIRMDVFVDNLISCEIKAVETVNPLWQAQVLSQLRLTRKHVGFLINFTVIKIKDGIRRYCLE